MSDRWLQRSVLVTVGTGGVGKTTLAAAIALEAAARGRRTLVLTIDPARRLAQALGLRTLDHEPQQVPADRIGAAPRGALFAMMLDTKRTFDEIVERFAPDPEQRRRIFANPIYRQLTDALSGSREYSALEKLAEIHAAGGYDLIVLDTPPAAHALDFLDAPRRVLGFLDGGFLELLLLPGKTGLRWLRFGSELTLRTLERLTGFAFLADLGDFFGAFEGLLRGFRERAELTARLLRSRACGFVLIVGPDPEQVRRAVAFSARLREERVPLAGLVVNRMRTWPSGSSPDAGPHACKEAQRWLEPALGVERAARLVEFARRHAAAAERDRAAAEHVEKTLALERGDMHRLPLLAEDIHTPRGLRRLRAQLFAAAAASHSYKIDAQREA